MSSIDVLLTWYALTYLNIYEGNPILNTILQRIGLINGLIATKLIGLILLYTLIKHIRSEIKINIPYINEHNGQQIGVNIICSMMLIVVANNIYQIMVRI